MTDDLLHTAEGEATVILQEQRGASVAPRGTANDKAMVEMAGQLAKSIVGQG